MGRTAFQEYPVQCCLQLSGVGWVLTRHVIRGVLSVLITGMDP